MPAFPQTDCRMRTPSTIYTAIAQLRDRRRLEISNWRKRKHGYVRRCPAELHNGIAVARDHSSSMLANTCCTTLLMQGAPADSTACPG
jgi:hypothetical protein